MAFFLSGWGPLDKGQNIDLDLMLDEFYAEMGWDKDGKLKNEIV